MTPAGIAGAAVVFGINRLREDDRAGVSQPFDQQVIARGKIDVVSGVAAAGRSHISRIEGVLEGKNHPVYWHLFEVGIPPILLVEFGRPLQRIRQVPKKFARRRGTGRQGPLGRMAVEVSAAGDGTFAADIERCQRTDLSGVRDADDHSELLLYRRI